MFQIGHELPLFHSRRVRTVVGEGARHAGKQEFLKAAGRLSEKSRAGYPHRTIGTTPPGSAGVPPASSSLSCRSVSLRCGSQPLCRRELNGPGRSRALAPFPVDPGGGNGGGCAKICAGGTPALPGGSSFHAVVTPRSRYCRSIRAPLVIEGGPSVFVLIRVHWWFVFISGRLFHLFRIRTPGRRAG